MTAKLKIGSGLHRARKNRSRGPRPAKPAPHPMQPLVLDDGVVRFKSNAIVRFLLDHGGYDLNRLALLHFTDEDRAQFAQLIGYSVSGWGDLSYVPHRLANLADANADALLLQEARR